jgi:hypothetical protein
MAPIKVFKKSAECLVLNAKVEDPEKVSSTNSGLE